MREIVTTLLDVLGLLLVAAAAAVALAPWTEAGALAAAGALVLAGSWLGARK